MLFTDPSWFSFFHRYTFHSLDYVMRRFVSRTENSTVAYSAYTEKTSKRGITTAAYRVDGAVSALLLCRVRCWPLDSILDRSISSGISYFMYMRIKDYHVVRDRQFCRCSSVGLVGGLVGGWLWREKNVQKALAILASGGAGTQQRAVHNIHVKRWRRWSSIFTLP